MNSRPTQLSNLSLLTPCQQKALLPLKHLRKLIDLLRMDHLPPIKKFFSRNGKHSRLKLYPFGRALSSIRPSLLLGSLGYIRWLIRMWSQSASPSFTSSSTTNVPSSPRAVRSSGQPPLEAPRLAPSLGTTNHLNTWLAP